MQRLLLLGPKEIQSGLYPGVGKAAVPLWSGGMNVAFRELGLTRIRGGRELSGTTVMPRALVQAYVEGQQRAYMANATQVTLDKLHLGVWTHDVIHTWATASSYVDLETWGAWLVMSNGADPLSVWKNTGLAAPLAGTTFTRAQVLKRKNPFLLAMNTSNGDTMVEWCSDDDIETWTPLSSNMAGNFNIRDLDSEIVAAADLGNAVAIYSRSRMSLGRFIGGNNVWGFASAVKGVGAISRRSVVTVDPFNYGMTENGIFKTDGNSFAFLSDPAVDRWYRDRADFARSEAFWGFHDETLRCVTFFYIDHDGEWKSISYHYGANVFTTGNLPLTAGGGREVFGFPLVADPEGNLLEWQASDFHRGEAIEWNILTKPLDFGERSVNKVLQLVRVDGTWSEGNNIVVRALAHPEDENPEVVLDQPLERENYLDREAPYFSVEFTGEAPLTVTGVELFGVPGGLAL